MKNRPDRGPARVPTDAVRRGRGEGGAGARGGWTPQGVPGMPSPGLPPRAPPAQILVPVPWDVRPPGSREIQVEASGVGYNNVTTPAVIAGSAFTVPQDNVGVLRAVSVNINGALATTACIWTFRVNGIAVEGWSALTIFPRAAGSVSISWGADETFIPLNEGGATIDVLLTVLPADGATYQAGVSYHGWTYSKRLADRFAGLYSY